MLIIYFYMVIIKTYKVKETFFNKFLERLEFWKFSAGNFRTHNPNALVCCRAVEYSSFSCFHQ